MNTTSWTAIGSLLAIIIGLWKFFRGKVEYRKKEINKADEELDEAIKNKDTSAINASVDDINRM